MSRYKLFAVVRYQVRLVWGFSTKPPNDRAARGRNRSNAEAKCAGGVDVGVRTEGRPDRGWMRLAKRDEEQRVHAISGALGDPQWKPRCIYK